ncbi:MAG: hypothetical protein K2J89_02020, partial [Clostridia bacterium]|nr:hypothetical protein [Clostridia bacterium]
MDIRKKKFKGICLISVLIISCLCMASVLSCFIPKTFSIAISDVNSQVKIDELLVENESSKIIFDTDKLIQLYNALFKIKNIDRNTLKSIGTKTSADFRSNNNGSETVVTIGNIQWMPMYLSENNDGDPILTLWQANNDTIAKWNEQASNTNGNYPNNMYGTSYMRAVVLNNGGEYAKTYNATSLTPVDQDSTNTWSKFTMDNSDTFSGSLTYFIEVPDNMSWQHTQSAKNSASQSNDYNNDALDSGGTGTSYYGKTGYDNWAGDKIWLPSMAEIGVSNENGIWKASIEQRKNNVNEYSWLRSAYPNSYYFLPRIAPNGNGSDNHYTNVTGAVRPAFHLNLARVAEYASKSVSVTESVSKEYNAGEQGIENEEWFADIDLGKGVTINYYDKGTTTPRAEKPSAVGEYEVEIIFTDNTHYFADDITATSKRIPFTITQRRLDYPTFDNSKYSIQKNYAGDEEISFTLGSYDKNYIEVTYSGTDNGVSYD